jgi:hypothetical protein
MVLSATQSSGSDMLACPWQGCEHVEAVRLQSAKTAKAVSSCNETVVLCPTLHPAGQAGSTEVERTELMFSLSNARPPLTQRIRTARSCKRKSPPHAR